MEGRNHQQPAMKGFLVKVRTSAATFVYRSIAAAAIDLYPSAYDRFGACGVTVTPLRSA